MYEEGDELYMCLTDYEHELGEASGGTPVYASIEDLKATRSCVSECGIVAVRVMYVKTIDSGIHPADRGNPPSNA